MSPSSELILRLPATLHARPAGQLVQVAAKFDAQATVGLADRHVDARSVLAVMGLGAMAGDEVILRATGPQASEALAALAQMLIELREVEVPS